MFVVYFPNYKKAVKLLMYSRKQTELKMAYSYLTISLLLGTLQGITALIDTSNYKILIDNKGGDNTFWEAQCRGEMNFHPVLLIKNILRTLVRWKLQIEEKERIFKYILFLKFNLSGLGNNWALAIAETKREGYALANFVTISNNIHHYLIGGSTVRQLNKTMKWNHYRLDNRGISQVKV